MPIVYRASLLFFQTLTWLWTSTKNTKHGHYPAGTPEGICKIPGKSILRERRGIVAVKLDRSRPEIMCAGRNEL
jgi:hypothetical protein